MPFEEAIGDEVTFSFGGLDGLEGGDGGTVTSSSVVVTTTTAG